MNTTENATDVEPTPDPFGAAERLNKIKQESIDAHSDVVEALAEARAQRDLLNKRIGHLAAEERALAAVVRSFQPRTRKPKGA